MADIHFLLPESGLSIVGETFLPISHSVMGAGPGPYAAAYSHPQALGQTRQYLRANGIVPMAYADTARRRRLCQGNGRPRCLRDRAPDRCRALRAPDLVAEGVEDAHDNTTRFVLLANEALDPASLAGEDAMTTLRCSK